MSAEKGKGKEPLIRMAKRDTLSNQKAWCIRGVALLLSLITGVNYWVMEYHLMSVGVQAILITLFVVFDALIIYILYKKVIYKHLDNIKKNIEELKDICTE